MTPLDPTPAQTPDLSGGRQSPQERPLPEPRDPARPPRPSTLRSNLRTIKITTKPGDQRRRPSCTRSRDRVEAQFSAPVHTVPQFANNKGIDVRPVQRRYWSAACIQAGPLGDDGGQFYTLGKEGSTNESTMQTCGSGRHVALRWC